MFTKTIFAAGALLSIVAAVPLQQQNKRDIYYETKTMSEVTTIDVTTTVWLNAGETPPAKAHYGHGYGHHSKVTSHIQSTVTVPAASPAWSSSPAEQPSYEAPGPSSPVAAPTTSAHVPAPAPTSQAPPPAPEPTTSPSGGSPSGGGQFSGQEATYYTPGLGSCGMTNSEGDSIVALAAGMMTAAMTDGNPNHNPLCGKGITITYNGVSVQATIVDTCPGCSDAGLDLTPTLFAQLAPLSTGRLFGVSWSYN